MLYQKMCRRNITIAKLVKYTGMTSRTFRFYEQIGLIRSYPRFNRKYQRVYPAGVMMIIQQIRLFKRAGLKLKQIKEKINMLRDENVRILHDQKENLLYEIKQIRWIVKTINKISLAIRGRGSHLQRDERIMMAVFKRGFWNFEDYGAFCFRTILC